MRARQRIEWRFALSYCRCLCPSSCSPPLLRSLLALALLGTFAQTDAAGRRVALVIGNSAYVSVPQLAFPCLAPPGEWAPPALCHSILSPRGKSMARLMLPSRQANAIGFLDVSP